MSSLGTASSGIPRRKLKSNSVIGTSGVAGADPDRFTTLPLGAINWIATTRWLVARSAPVEFVGRIRLQRITMVRTLARGGVVDTRQQRPVEDQVQARARERECDQDDHR